MIYEGRWRWLVLRVLWYMDGLVWWMETRSLYGGCYVERVREKKRIIESLSL